MKAEVYSKSGQTFEFIYLLIHISYINTPYNEDLL